MTRMMLLALFVVGLSVSPGCSSLTKNKKDSPWGALQFWKKGYQQPAKMAVLWSHDVLTMAGQAPTRGFGGRIYFYNNKSQTIPVEGELVVHGFDESLKRATGAPENEPDKRFRFTAEQFTEHFSESDLGASYSIWIPWDAVDGLQKEITLLPTFVSSKGEMVQGSPAKVVLPGRTKPGSDQRTPVQTVAYEQSSMPTVSGGLPQVAPASPSKPAAGMRTTTIQVPSSAGRHRASSNTATIPSAAANMAQAPSPQVSAALEQAKAQVLADALRPSEPLPQRPVQGYSAWTPNKVPTAGSTAVNFNNIMPPNWSQTSAPPAGHATPAREEETQDLPPGIQLSPRATAW
jgi:hypothetical protein